MQEYKHKIQLRVRTFEIDSQGLVHNSVYLQYYEIGRVEYRRNLGYEILKDGTFSDGLKVVVVNNTINYKSFAYLDNLLNIYTKISWIKNSSFCFDQIIENDSNKEIISDAKGILVNLNPENNLPQALNEKFINEIKNFEKNLILVR